MTPDEIKAELEVLRNDHIKLCELCVAKRQELDALMTSVESLLSSVQKSSELLLAKNAQLTEAMERLIEERQNDRDEADWWKGDA